MNRKTIEGGWYADALPSGEWAVCRHDGPTVETHLGVLTAPDRPLYLRIADAAPFRIAGIRHGEGSEALAALKDRVIEWGASGQEWHTHAFKACGPNGVIYDHAGVLRASDCGPGIGSQGFRYATAAGLVTGQQTYEPKHGVELHEWTDLGHGYRVGQGPNDNGAWFYDGQAYYEVVAGNARFVRARLAGDRLSIACYIAINGRPPDAVIVWATVDEIRATFPAKASPRLVTPAPSPAPTPAPPMENPTPMPKEPVSPLPWLESMRSDYPATMTPDQCVELLNRAAHAAGNGWGLLLKSSGNRGARFDGVPCSVDWLVNLPAGVGGDFLIGAGSIDDGPGPAAPSHPTLEPFDTTRWVAPIAPVANAPTPPPTPESPAPTPQPPVTCQCDLAPVVARLEAVESQLTALINKPTSNPTVTFPLYEGDLNLGWLGTKRLTLRPKAQE
jgi:hypothetical protein